MMGKSRVGVGVLTCSLLVACGGGGDGGTALQPQPTPDTFAVGGSITGLNGTGLILENNGGDALSIANKSTTFKFATRLVRGAKYDVKVARDPAGQTCSVAKGTGTIDAEVTSVAVNCVTNLQSGMLLQGSVLAQDGSSISTLSLASEDGQRFVPLSERTASAGAEAVTSSGRIVYFSGPTLGQSALMAVSADGSDRVVLAPVDGNPKFVISVTPDDRVIFVRALPSTRRDIVSIRSDGTNEMLLNLGAASFMHVDEKGRAFFMEKKSDSDDRQFVSVNADGSDRRVWPQNVSLLQVVSPLPNGRLLIASTDSESKLNLFSVEDGGGSEVQLTHVANYSFFEGMGSDGRIFFSDRRGNNALDFLAISPDGALLPRLTDSAEKKVGWGPATTGHLIYQTISQSDQMELRSVVSAASGIVDIPLQSLGSLDAMSDRTVQQSTGGRLIIERGEPDNLDIVSVLANGAEFHELAATAGREKVLALSDGQVYFSRRVGTDATSGAALSRLMVIPEAGGTETLLSPETEFVEEGDLLGPTPTGRVIFSINVNGEQFPASIALDGAARVKLTDHSGEKPIGLCCARQLY